MDVIDTYLSKPALPSAEEVKQAMIARGWFFKEYYRTNIGSQDKPNFVVSGQIWMNAINVGRRTAETYLPVRKDFDDHRARLHDCITRVGLADGLPTTGD